MIGSNKFKYDPVRDIYSKAPDLMPFRVDFSIFRKGWNGLFLKNSVFLIAFFCIVLGRFLKSLSKVAVVEISIY